MHLTAYYNYDEKSGSYLTKLCKDGEIISVIPTDPTQVRGRHRTSQLFQPPPPVDKSLKKTFTMEEET